MTPAIKLAKRAKIDHTIHEYEHDVKAESYGLEASEKLGVKPEQVFKTLVVTNEQNQLLVAILPVNQLLSLKKMAKAVGAKKIKMADKKLVEKTTGYVLGGVSPLGQKKRLPTVIDDTAQTQASIYVSAGKRGLEIELCPQKLAETLNASFADIAQVSE